MLSIVLFFGLAGRVGPEQSARSTCSPCTGISWMPCGLSFFTVVYVLAAEGRENGNAGIREKS